MGKGVALFLGSVIIALLVHEGLDPNKVILLPRMF